MKLTPIFTATASEPEIPGVVGARHAFPAIDLTGVFGSLFGSVLKGKELDGKLSVLVGSEGLSERLDISTDLPLRIPGISESQTLPQPVLDLAKAFAPQGAVIAGKLTFEEAA